METQSSFSNHSEGTLFLVPTPIGNLEDMTFRAIKTLNEVDLIAAETTSNTQKLLNHFEIKTEKVSFREDNKREQIPFLVQKLKKGLNIAQVSDAGMPSISDPGHELVVECIKNNISVVSLPGPSAGITALIASGLPPQPFYFYGFLNRKKSKQVEELQSLSNRPETVIFYEAPHRLKKTLKNMNQVLGSKRKGVLARELTKKFEDFHRGTLSELLNWADSNQVRGEFVILVDGNNHPDTNQDTLSELPLVDQVKKLIDDGKRPNDAIKMIAKKHKMKKQEVYNLYHHL